jgi:predicted site-specific integrase-resolvase
MSDTPQLMTVAQACAWSGIPRATLYRRFIATGLLPTTKIGAATRVLASDLAKLVNAIVKGV